MACSPQRAGHRRGGPRPARACWSKVLGSVELGREDDGSIGIGPPGAGFGGRQPTLILSPSSDRWPRKLRLHIDVRATDRVQDAELDRLLLSAPRPPTSARRALRAGVCWLTQIAQGLIGSIGALGLAIGQLPRRSGVALFLGLGQALREWGDSTGGEEAVVNHALSATALLVVDVQRDMLELDSPIPSAAAVRPVVHALLKRARAAGAAVVHVQNDGNTGEPDEIGTAGWELVFAPEDGEVVLRKEVPDAFAAGTTLTATLTKRGVSRVVVCGMLSDHCVAATSRGALRNGFAVVVASGAHGTYDQDQSAATISAGVEAELLRDGVDIQAAADIDFHCRTTDAARVSCDADDYGRSSP